MTAYATACEFYAKADYEGGLWDMILGYGVSEADVPPEVWPTIEKLKEAANDVEFALAGWHKALGGCVPSEMWDEDDDCPWGDT